MKNSPNIYLTLIVIGIIVFSVNRFKDEKEHFGNPLSLLKKIGQGMIDFFFNFIDILLVIADVFSFIAMIPFIIMDLIMILITWLNPISMIKGVVSSIFIITKILLLSMFDIIAHIARMFFAKIFSFLAGGLWGIPHGPDQHRTHNEIETGYADKFGDHHHDHDALHLNKRDYTDLFYRPLRCYKSVGSEGWVNMIATIICPPLGVFMAFGVKGYLKIIVCSVLSLAYYIPGLVYALLITTHLGLGRHITAKDCGGIANYGIRIAGCSTINNEKDCKAATIPGWRDRNGNPIRSCIYDEAAEGPLKCFNIIYPNAIHTFGNTDRLRHEVGGTSDHFEDDKIDKSREIAYDKVKAKYLNDNVNNPRTEKHEKVNYNPMYVAHSQGGDRDLEDTVNLDDVPGPWTFVGGD